MVTITLMGGTFDLAKHIKVATRQHYGDRDIITWCEQTLKVPPANVTVIVV